MSIHHHSETTSSTKSATRKKWFASNASAIAAPLFFVGACAATTSTTPPAESGATAPASNQPDTTGLEGLRPPGSEAVLAALDAEPGAAQHAAAAAYFATSDSAAMTLYWGLIATAIAPGGSHQGQVASAMQQTLRDRISIEAGSVSARLAPGQSRILLQDGTPYMPVVYSLEQEITMSIGMAAAATGSQNATDPTVILAMWDAYVGVQEQGGTPLKRPMVFDRWLVALRSAGHLPSFIALAFGLPESSAEARDAMQTWIDANPIQSSGEWVGGLRTLFPDSLFVAPLPNR